MPGPGNGRKKKTAKRPFAAGSTSASSPSQRFAIDIDDASGWDAIASALCDYLGLSDLSTKSGLKRIHTNFDSICERLEKTYENYDSYKVKGAVVAIWAKMCYDIILSNKLHSRGFLFKVFKLLEHPTTMELALSSLAHIAHSGIDNAARVSIAHGTSLFVRALQANPDHPKIAALVVMTLSHSIPAITTDAKPVKPADVAALGLREVFSAIMPALRHPHVRHETLRHAHHLFGCAARYAPSAVRESGALHYLIAFYRSIDTSKAFYSFRAMWEMLKLKEEPPHTPYPTGPMVEKSRLPPPPEVATALRAYTGPASEATCLVRAHEHFLQALVDFRDDRDLISLGRRITTAVLLAEHGVQDGAFVDTPGVALTMAKSGLPFERFIDALPVCAKRLQAIGELDNADILQCTYFVKKHRWQEAASLGMQAAERSPNQAFFFFVVSQDQERPERGLRYAKRGLKLPTTPYVRQGLLRFAIVYGHLSGLSALYNSFPGEIGWRAGIALLRGAYDDACTFMREAPPDSVRVADVARTLTILAPVIRGSELPESINEGEIGDALYRLRLSQATMTHIGFPDDISRLGWVSELVVSNYTTAVRDWEPVISRYNGLLAHKVLSSSDTPSTGEIENADTTGEDKLEKWLEDVDAAHAARQTPDFSFAGYGMHGTTLPTCTGCGSPSAVLRRCGKCNEARYCDAKCQQAHWSQHKEHCKKARSADAR